MTIPSSLLRLIFQISEFGSGSGSRPALYSVGESVTVLVDPSPNFKVNYPAPWQPRPVTKLLAGKSALDLILLHADKMMAYIRVKAIDPALTAGTSLDERKTVAAEEIAEGGISIVLPWQQDIDPSVRIISDIEDTYLSKGTQNGSQAEVRLGFVRRGTLIFAVTLISVSKEDDTLLWMHSKRAYEVALLTITPEAS